MNKHEAKPEDQQPRPQEREEASQHGSEDKNPKQQQGSTPQPQKQADEQQ